MRLRRSIALLSLACGCASQVGGGVRFANAPIVWQVDDRADVPSEPHELEFNLVHDYAYYNALFPLTHVMSVPVKDEAKNINALGEVPDSTWFVNRIGRFPVSPEEIRVGPDPQARPLPPLVISSGKPGGKMAGFVVEDAKGDRYIVKFDPVEQSDLETSSDVVAQRLLWAIGYHVPADEIIDLRLEDLRIGDDATYKDELGHKVPLTLEYIEGQLKRVQQSPDGSYRAQVSKYLPGVPIGGHAPAGVRPDDPNDLVPHEDRRDLRGAYLFFSWLAHTDYKQDNRIDMWVEDPHDPKRHFVMHYLVDFGKALGVFARSQKDWDDTWSYNIDYEWILLSAVALGLWKRPWEGEGSNLPGTTEQGMPFQGVGRFDVEHYEPLRYRPRTPYLPFMKADRFDLLWAAKILLRLQREHIEAAVAAGRYRNPGSARYVAETLIGRQRKAARAVLGRVNPIGDVIVEPTPTGDRLCAEDLWHRYELGDDRATYGHDAQIYDGRGRAVGPPVALRLSRGWVCLEGLKPADRTGYTMVRLSANRAGRALDPVWVHLQKQVGTSPDRSLEKARAPASPQFRVIGMWRRTRRDG